MGELGTMFASVQGIAISYGLKILIAVLILLIGRWLARMAQKLIKVSMARSDMDPTLVSFTSHLAYIVLMVFIVVAALNRLGIQTASFVALIGAGGLAIGLALQGSLSHFASGVIMVMFRPFKVGDYILGAGIEGTVDEIQVFSTLLRTSDNKRVIIPNGKLIGDNLVNFTVLGRRRIDLPVKLIAGQDVDRIRALLFEVIDTESRILKDQAPLVVVTDITGASVVLAVQAWVNNGDFNGVRSSLLEQIKKKVDELNVPVLA